MHTTLGLRYSTPQTSEQSIELTCHSGLVSSSHRESLRVNLVEPIHKVLGVGAKANFRALGVEPQDAPGPGIR